MIGHYALTLNHGYVFAEMAVHQTREFMHKKYGTACRILPNIAQDFLQHIAKPRFLS